jgi:hypothetical protein
MTAPTTAVTNHRCHQPPLSPTTAVTNYHQTLAKPTPRLHTPLALEETRPYSARIDAWALCWVLIGNALAEGGRKHQGFLHRAAAKLTMTTLS